jgi:hypothetical protein
VEPSDFVRALRAVASVVLLLSATGGIPGAALRTRPSPATALALASASRDGAVALAARSAPEETPLGGVHARAFAIDDGRASLVGEGDTDASGRVRLAHLPRGECWILADAPGRARSATRLAIDSGERAVTIDLGPEHAIDLTVKDELGAPAASAEIEVSAAEGEASELLPVAARTDQLGQAHVGRLGAGPWRVRVRALGFEEATARVEREGAPVALVLRKLGAIVAHVVGEDAMPAPGARVAVAGVSLWPARVAACDEHGDVRIANLEAGTYALRATKGDAVSAIEFDVGLARGERKEVTLRLSRGFFVNVRATDGDFADAPPVAAAKITLAEGGLSPFPLEATTDATGHARLGPIAPGGAAVSVRAEGYVPRGGVGLDDPPPAEMRINLVRAGVLVGRVVDGRGRPIGGATIAIAGTDARGQPILDDPRRATFQAAHFDAMLGGPAPLVPAGELGVVPGPVPAIPNPGSGPLMGSLRARPPDAHDVDPWVTRADGTFRASPASPGRVRAIARHPEYVDAESGPLTIEPGGETSVDIVMRSGGALEGRVLDAHERPIEHARVEVAAMSGSLERAARTATDGSFAFVALPDSVVLTVTAPGAGEGGDAPDARMTIVVPEGGRREVSVVLPEPRETLPLTVVDDRGFPVEAAQVTVTSLAKGAWLRATAFTDAHGTASIAKGRGLPLRVEARAPSKAPRFLSTSGTEESLRIELAPAERATGEVVTQRGRDPVAGAVVTLYSDLGARRARTDARRGAFALSDLAPGAARLVVRAVGFAPASEAITVPDSGGRRPFALPRIELAPEGSVEGDVVDDRGEPVAGARVALDSAPTWLVVGQSPDSIAVTDARGHFVLHELPEGAVTLEAYAAGLGRARETGVPVVAGRTTDDLRITIAPGDDDASPTPSEAAGGVAMTLAESGGEVVIASVAERSEAERGGAAPGDVLLAVDEAPAGTIMDARIRLGGPLGSNVLLKVRRGDETLILPVVREAVRR